MDLVGKARSYFSDKNLSLERIGKESCLKNKENKRPERTGPRTSTSVVSVTDVKRQMENYAPEEILNTDQVGLELEFRSTRTLSDAGEHVTEARVRSKKATTHSYTVQPMMSLAGKLVGPIFHCFKEPNRKMSEVSRLTTHLSFN